MRRRSASARSKSARIAGQRYGKALAAMEDSRRRAKRTEPARYQHIWEGQPDDMSDRPKVLTYDMVNKCVKAWDLRPKPRGAFRTAGLDIADTGADKNCLSVRAGPELYRIVDWKGSEEWTIADTARKSEQISTC